MMKRARPDMEVLICTRVSRSIEEDWQNLKDSPRYRSIMQELQAKASLENFSYELMAATLSMRICEDTQEVESTSVWFSFMQGKGFPEKEVVAASAFMRTCEDTQVVACPSLLVKFTLKICYMETEIVATNESIAFPSTLDVLKHYLFKRKPRSANTSKKCVDKRDKIDYQKQEIHTR